MLYDFSWDMDNYLIKVNISVPESKDDPFPFYSSTIMYHTKDAIKNNERLDALSEKLTQDELDSISNFNKKIEMQKNENRKKDF